jgi:hypothetical protein
LSGVRKPKKEKKKIRSQESQCPPAGTTLPLSSSYEPDLQPFNTFWQGQNMTK